jgi:hypothetical protein
MLFLLNDTVIDLGDPETALIDAVGVIGLRHDRLRQKDIVEMAQQVWFNAGYGREPVPAVQRAIAALVAMKLDADAALIIVPPLARSPADVRTRFASASIPLMSRMYAMQGAGGLTPRVINDTVWNAARPS